MRENLMHGLMRGERAKPSNLLYQFEGRRDLPMAGRKPKPTAVKKLEGNPGKRKLNSKEPVPAKGMGTQCENGCRG